MKAVFSFWSKPHRTRRSAWASEAHHLFSWALAVHTAGRHYPTCLVTDDEGKRLLVQELGLRFDECSVKLNALSNMDAGWWALGKIYAYQMQKEPFVHVDADAYLWKRLPERIEQAPAFAQNAAQVVLERSSYRPKVIRAALETADHPWIPEEWEWYESMGGNMAAECGLVGGQRADFLSHYGRMALKLVKHPVNRHALSALQDKPSHTVTLEQWFLEACVRFHRGREASPYHDIEMAYLFDSWADALNDEKAREAGFTHLLCDAKRNPRIAARLEARVRHDLPQLHQRCRDLAAEQERERRR